MVTHFAKLFSKPQPYSNVDTLNQYDVPKVSQHHIYNLMAHFALEEITIIIFNMHPNKALRIDGFIMRF